MASFPGGAALGGLGFRPGLAIGLAFGLNPLA